jgi:hypothetical protein
MRRLLFVLTIAITIPGLATLTGAQCLEPIGSWGFGPTEGAHGNGSIAAFGSGRMLRIARIADPANPTIAASLEMPGMVSHVQIEGSWAYVAAGSGGFVVVDVSSPNHPEIAAVFETEDRMRGMVVAGDLAFLGDGFRGLVIVDVSDPAAPVELSALALDGNVEDIAVFGSLAFLAESYTGLRVVDVSDPSNPVSVAVIDELDHSRRIAVADDGMTAYLTNYFEGFHVIDISDHTAPEIVGFVEVPSYTIDVETNGDFLYVANRENGLRVFDLAAPQAPVEVQQVDRDGENQSVAIHGDLAYLGNYTAGLRLVDVSDPREAEEVGFIDGTPESKGVAIQGGIAYVAGGNQQTILDLARPDLPAQSSSTDFNGYVRRAAVDGRYVYAAGDYRGLRVIDIADPEHPEEVGFVEADTAYDVVKDGHLVYLSCSAAGIRVVDVSDPTAPTVIGTLEGFRAGFINIAGGVLYVPEYNVGVHVVDVTDPTSPFVHDTMDVTKPLGRPAVNGDLLYIADSTQGVKVFDSINPLTPVELSTISGARFGFGMAAVGELLFVATIYDGAFVFDVSDPSAPVELATGELATLAEGDVDSEGNLVAVAEISGGLEIFDLAECSAASPSADFTWRPSDPEAGRSVQLTDTSIGAVATRQWSFGDGATSTVRNPQHIWSEAGDYQVTLTVGGPYGSRTVSRTLTVNPRSGGVPPITDPGDYAYVIAAAAHAQGLENTEWVTDAVLHNPGASPAQAYVWLMEQGRNNIGAEGTAVSVEAGGSVMIDDIVLSVFGENDGSGAILVGSDQPLLVTSRTYNDAATGTYGQFIRGRPVSSAVGRGDSVRLVQLTRSTTFRTNLGVANPTESNVRVDVSLRDSDGVEIGSTVLTVPPFGYLQRTDILGADVDDAIAVVSSATDSAAYFPYASVVDNRTGDPMMVEPIDPATQVVIAAAAHVAGLEDTDWRTDLEICNAGASPVEVELDLLRSNQNNTNPSSALIDLGGMTCDRLEDVLDATFGYEGSAALGVRSKLGEVVVSSRTFNTTDAGTYGQCLPAFPEDDALTVGREGRIVQLAQSLASASGFRTNIGFVNRAPFPVNVDVDLMDGTGASLGTLTIPLQGFEHRQINRIFRQVTAAAVNNGIAVVSTSSAGGSFVAYASVVDNASGDPVYIPALEIGD